VSAQRPALQVPASPSASQGDPSTERATEPHLQEFGVASCVAAVGWLRSTNRYSTGQFF